MPLIRLGVVLLLAVTLAACGDDDDDEPTSAPTPPPATQASSTSASAVAATPVDGSATAVAATPEILNDTVGRLADGITAAWPSVPYRRVVINTPSPGATPTAGLASVTTTDEVLPPGSVHRTVFDGSGATVAEFILVDDRLYGRGSLIQSVFTTGLDAETWIAFSDEMVAPGTPGGNALSQLRALLQPRFVDLGEDERDRAATLVNVVEIDGRTCVIYESTETTQTGEAITVEIGLTEEGLLCSVTTSGGGLDGVEAYSFDVPVTIEAPSDVATPAAIPATPAARPLGTPAPSTPAP